LVPQVPNEFQGTFLLGLFDGDGNIYVNKKHKRWSICCTTATQAKKIRDELCDGLGQIENYYKTYHRIKTHRRLDIEHLACKMYANAPIYLSYKYDALQPFIKPNTPDSMRATQEFIRRSG